MLKNQSKSINGQSIVTIDGTDTCVVTMSANVQESGVITLCETIHLPEVYVANKKDVDADIQSFKDSVLGGVE